MESSIPYACWVVVMVFLSDYYGDKGDGWEAFLMFSMGVVCAYKMLDVLAGNLKHARSKKN